MNSLQLHPELTVHLRSQTPGMHRALRADIAILYASSVQSNWLDSLCAKSELMTRRARVSESSHGTDAVSKVKSWCPHLTPTTLPTLACTAPHQSVAARLSPLQHPQPDCAEQGTCRMQISPSKHAFPPKYQDHATDHLARHPSTYSCCGGLDVFVSNFLCGFNGHFGVMSVVGGAGLFLTFS